MKNIILHIAIVSFCLSSTHAQSVSSITVSAIGAFADGGKATSLALSISKSTDCLQLNTGLALYSGIMGHLPFVMTCKTDAPTLPVDIKLYPNPVENYTRLVSSLPTTNSSPFQLSVIDALGRIVMVKQISATLLSAGISLYFGQLPSGNYFLKLDRENLHHVIPFIKVK